MDDLRSALPLAGGIALLAFAGPALSRALDGRRAEEWESRVRRDAVALLTYAADADDRCPPANTHGRPYRLRTADRIWSQTIFPYNQDSFSYRRPGDPKDADALQSVDPFSGFPVERTDPWYRYVRALRSGVGMNLAWLSPWIEGGSRPAAIPGIEDAARLPALAETVWGHDPITGEEVGGGRWVFASPCPGHAPLGPGERLVPLAPDPTNYLAATYGGRIRTAFLDSHVRARRFAEFAGDCVSPPP